ncbi:FAD dependent oxidoreductase [Amanita rubescens]|nr:FAD dependent oxidoreductase [Amanita rubescens]
MTSQLFLASFLAVLAFGNPHVERSFNSYLSICSTISNTISSSSAVYYPGSTLYAKDIYHFANSSVQQSACTVEPGSANDVGKILHVLGSTRTPFSVKSGGHTMNPGFSSSSAIQIALYRFSDISYNPASQTVTIGSGLIFDDVYAALTPYNITITGGRVSGVGVGGYLLGGGYSWKSNQYGLAIDTIIAYQLVKPNGDVVTVTEETDSELFFGLKGGYNNFGIVTQFTLMALPLPTIWGGTIIFPESSVPDVTAALSEFSATNSDPKGNTISFYTYENDEASQRLYYDGPNPPPGLFDKFLNIPYTSSNVQTSNFTDFIYTSGSNATANMRGVFHVVPLLEFTPDILNVIQNETVFWGKTLAGKALVVRYALEPYMSTLLSHNNLSTAFPPTRDVVYLPVNLYYIWTDSAYDQVIYDAVHESAAYIVKAALAQGQNISNGSYYPNYAIFDTPSSGIYGAHLDRLRALKREVDPHNVMGLAGGYKF